MAQQLHEDAEMLSELPLVGRQSELRAVRAVIDQAANRRGGALLITGEAGIGKSRLLLEARREAERRDLLVLRGRALNTGGAYRPLVEAFARAAAPFADDPRMAGVRPVLARVLPGWQAGEGMLAPMADPSAVLGQALTMVLQEIAPGGSVLLMDDLHWADADTLRVLCSLVDATEDLPLAVLLTARDEAATLSVMSPLLGLRSLTPMPLVRLTPAEVAAALRPVTETADGLDELVAAVDGLPLVLDELVQHARTNPSLERGWAGGAVLAGAVRLRLVGISADSRTVLEALAVIGECDPAILGVVAALDEQRLGAAIHEAIASTLLVPRQGMLGAAWRHPLFRDVITEMLLPLERQAYARRGADHLITDEHPTDGRLHQAAGLYELAGYPQLAAQQLVAAARLAVRGAALQAADRYLADALELSGRYPGAAWGVLVERIELLTLAGRAGDAYTSGLKALERAGDSERGLLLPAVIRAAYGAGLQAEAAGLLARLEVQPPADELSLDILRARAAQAARRPEAEAMAEDVARRALADGRFDLACEALAIAGATVRRTDLLRAKTTFERAFRLSHEHQLRVWEPRLLAELGHIEALTDSDPGRLRLARKLAVTAGMVGLVAEIDLLVGEVISLREGLVIGYVSFERADTEARRLRLTGLSATTRGHLASCLSHAGDRALPGTDRTPSRADFDAMIMEASATGQVSRPILWVGCVTGMRAWLEGDDATAATLITESMEPYQQEVKGQPWWGVGMLLRVIAGERPESAFGPSQLFGHHANLAAYAYAAALAALRSGRSGAAEIDEADHHVRQTPFIRHLLRSVVAPAMHEVGSPVAEPWLREAEAFCAGCGERAMQRRIRLALAKIGAKLPRTTTTLVPPHLARLSLTPREVEILELVNQGLSNQEIASQLVISVRTVESHVSRLLAKAGMAGREQLRGFSSSASG